MRNAPGDLTCGIERGTHGAHSGKKKKKKFFPEKKVFFWSKKALRKNWGPNFMFSKFLKKKVQDIDRTHKSIVEAHFLADHVVPNFFSSEQLYESASTLNLKILVNFGQKT